MACRSSLVFFAYEGFEKIATLSEKVREPPRNIPRALGAAVIVTTVIYVLVAAVAVSVVPWEQLAIADAPLAAVGSGAAYPRPLHVAAPMMGDALLLVALCDVQHGAAAAGDGPTRDVRHGEAGAAAAGGGACLARAGDAVGGDPDGDDGIRAVRDDRCIGFVAQVTNFAVFTLFVVVNGALIRLRVIRPDAVRPS